MAANPTGRGAQRDSSTDVFVTGSVVCASTGLGSGERSSWWSASPRRNSLRLRPKDWAAAGSRLGPSNTSAMTRTISSSTGPTLGIALHGRFVRHADSATDHCLDVSGTQWVEPPICADSGVLNRVGETRWPGRL